MDFGTIIYIILIVGWFLFSIFKNMKKEEEERQAMKNRTHTVIVEENGEIKQQKSKKKKKAQPSPVMEEVNNGEYFSYETMSDRDFEKEFQENVESEISMQHSENQNAGLHLTLDEEEVYKGVVWSEILKRKC